MPNVNPNSGGQKNGGQPLAPSDNYGSSDDDEDGQYDDIDKYEACATTELEAKEDTDGKEEKLNEGGRVNSDDNYKK